VHSPVVRMCVDTVETFVYLACENLNVYQYPLFDSAMKKRATMSHKKRVTAMTLSKDGRYLVSGDAQGLMYIWQIITEE